jgi:predicted AAA+ superfamily ATPase
MEENQFSRPAKGEIHHNEAVEEKIALSDRFGLWLSFYPFDQKGYIEIVNAWLHYYGVAAEFRERAIEAALQWALLRGSCSGRTARIEQYLLNSLPRILEITHNRLYYGAQYRTFNMR